MKNIVFDVPNGPENLKSIFPEINWSQVQSYSAPRHRARDLLGSASQAASGLIARSFKTPNG